MNEDWMPREFRIAPKLDHHFVPQMRGGRYALLINPFYRKDPRASFGKHVLTPTLALLEIRGAESQHLSV